MYHGYGREPGLRGSLLMKEKVKFEEMELEEKKISSAEVYKGSLLHVFRDEIELPDGTKSAREFIVHWGAVCIVALDEENNVVIERQFRYPFHRTVMEIPAGKLDAPDEDPLLAAKRELREETGITAENFRYLGTLYPSVAYTTEVIHMYLATELSYGERELDEDESVNFEFIPLAKVVDMILDGEIPDSKTQIAVLKVWTLLHSYS